MARIRRVVGRNAVLQTLDICLYVVVPASRDLRTLDDRNKYMPQVILLQETFLMVAQVIRFGTALFVRFPAVGRNIVRCCRYGFMVAVEHQTRYLLDRHLSNQIIYPLLDRPAPVLVHVEPAVAVEILEGITVLGKYDHTRFGRIPQRRAALLDYDIVTVGRRFRPFTPMAAAHACRNRNKQQVFQTYFHKRCVW